MVKPMRMRVVLLGCAVLGVVAVGWWSRGGRANWQPPKPVGRLAHRYMPLDPDPRSVQERSHGFYTFAGELDQERKEAQADPDGVYRRILSFTRWARDGQGQEQIMVVLVNLRQVAFRAHGKAVRQYRFRAENGEAVDIPLEIGVPPGKSEVTVLVFGSPGEQNQDPKVRRRLERPVAKRRIVRNGPGELPTLAYTHPQEEVQVKFLDGGVDVTQDPDLDMLRPWVWHDAVPGESLPYYLYVGRQARPDRTGPHRQAVLAFLNWEQVGIFGQPALLAETELDRIGRWQGQLQAPMQPGFHEWQVVSLRYPYDLEGFDQADAAPRLGLMVRQESR